MNTKEIESRIAPLLRAAPARDARWLRSLFTAPATHEAFTALDNELFIRNSPHAGPLLVTSATRGEGRTTFALLLAVLSSALDPARRVLLVDADTDNGRLGRILGLGTEQPGLVDYFDGTAPLEACIHSTGLPNLFVVPLASQAAGTIRQSPRLFREFVEGLRGKFDLSVIDSPAGGPNKGILSMASTIRSTLLVVRYGGPTREQVIELLSDLKRAGADVLGCVLNQREYPVPRLFYGHR